MTLELVLHSTSTMATSSNSSTTILSSLANQVIKKLTKSNYHLWHAQVMPAIRSAQLQGFLTGFEKEPPETLPKTVGDTIVIEPNLAHALWVSREQAMFGYLFTSLSREVLTRVATLTSLVEVWNTLASMYMSHTRAHSVQTCTVLATSHKGARSVVEYYTKMCSYFDELATSGHLLGNEEFVSYPLAGLDEDFDSMVSPVVAHVEPITLAELYSQMLIHVFLPRSTI
jgi:hypothetical protein